jgi:hypothetical protein
MWILLAEQTTPVFPIRKLSKNEGKKSQNLPIVYILLYHQQRQGQANDSAKSIYSLILAIDSQLT